MVDIRNDGVDVRYIVRRNYGICDIRAGKIV